jgi:predicted PurR-regulated permease PerM
VSDPTSEGQIAAAGADHGLPRGYHVLVTTAASIVVIAGIRAFHSSLGPIFLALVIVVVVSPIHGALRRRGAPPWLAMAGLAATAFGILMAILAALVWSTAELVTLLSSESYTNQMGDIQDAVADQLDRVGVTGNDLEQAVGRIDLGAVAGRISSIFSGLLNVTSAIGLLVLTLLFMVLDTSRFDRNLRTVAAQRPDVAKALQQFARQTRSYFVISTIFGLIVAAFDVVALMILGIPLALVWGMLSLITNYIPNIGFVIGLVPPALLGYFEGGWQLAVWVTVAYTVINVVIQSVIQPRVVGDAVGLSATLTLLSLIFWGWVIGPLGALLAVPMTLLAKALLIDIDPATRWAGPLISLSTAATSGELLPPPDPPSEDRVAGDGGGSRPAVAVDGDGEQGDADGPGGPDRTA